MHMSVGWLAMALYAGAFEPTVAASTTRIGPSDPKSAPPTETLFIRAEHVITRPGQDLENGQVLVRNGRILAVGTDLRKPDDAREIVGRYVCAGMIDAWGAIGLADDVAGDGTTTAATRTTDGLDPYNFDVLRRDALRAGITSARVQAGSTSRIGGLGALVRLAPGLSREEMTIVPDCNLWMTVGLSQPGQPQFEQQGDQIVMTGFGSRPMDPFERIEGVDRLVSMLQAGKSYLIQHNF
jgi:hypothetical protein